MRSRRERWSRASRWRRPPAAPMILSGRAAKSDANRPRANRRWHPFHLMEQWPLRASRRSRKSFLRFNPARRRSGTFSDLAMHRASRRLRIRLPFARRAMSDDRRGYRASSRAGNSHSQPCNCTSGNYSWNASIPPARRRPARRTRHQQRQRKANAARDPQRAERIVLPALRHALRAVAKGLAAVLIGALRIADGGISGVARGVLGLAVQVLHRAFGLTGAARGLGLSIARDIADSALDFTGDILGRAGDSILVHRAHSLR